MESVNTGRSGRKVNEVLLEPDFSKKESLEGNRYWSVLTLDVIVALEKEESRLKDFKTESRNGKIPSLKEESVKRLSVQKESLDRRSVKKRSVKMSIQKRESKKSLETISLSSKDDD